MNMLDRLAALRPAAATAALALLFAVALALDVGGVSSHRGHWLADLLIGLVVCAVALLRGHSRLCCAVAGLVICAAAVAAGQIWPQLPGQPGAAAYLGLLVLVGSAVRALPARLAVTIAAGAAAVAGTAMAWHDDVAGALGSGWAAAVAAGLLLRLLDVRRQAGRDAVRREERLDLARELHDTAAHHLTAMVVQAQAARLAARKQPGLLDQALAAIETEGNDALASMRRVVGLLRDPADGAGLAAGAGQLAPARLPDQLAELADRFARRGTSVGLQLPEGPAWSAEVNSTVYRVVQEALTNVARHAPGASAVNVTVARHGDAITVEVTDDAPAARPGPAGGYGLVGMRERVEALGGKLSAGPRPPAGWAVCATLPVPARA